MPRARTIGPALDPTAAAAYIGWDRLSLVKHWRKRPLLRAAAIKDGRRLTFYVSGLDAYLAANKVETGRSA